MHFKTRFWHTWPSHGAFLFVPVSPAHLKSGTRTFGQPSAIFPFDYSAINYIKNAMELLIEPARWTFVNGNKRNWWCIFSRCSREPFRYGHKCRLKYSTSYWLSAFFVSLCAQKRKLNGFSSGIWPESFRLGFVLCSYFCQNMDTFRWLHRFYMAKFKSLAQIWSLRKKRRVIK